MIILAQMLVVCAIVCFAAMVIPFICECINNGIEGDRFELAAGGLLICLLLLMIGFLIQHWPYLWDMP